MKAANISNDIPKMLDPLSSEKLQKTIYEYRLEKGGADLTF